MLSRCAALSPRDTSGLSSASAIPELLLDPDATIRIDLHKRLFLLVTGRGE
jgi:hypothetical protein